MRKVTTSFYIGEKYLDLLRQIQLNLTKEERENILENKRGVKAISRNDVLELCIKYAWEHEYKRGKHI